MLNRTKQEMSNAELLNNNWNRIAYLSHINDKEEEFNYRVSVQNDFSRFGFFNRKSYVLAKYDVKIDEIQNNHSENILNGVDTI